MSTKERKIKSYDTPYLTEDMVLLALLKGKHSAKKLNHLQHSDGLGIKH